MEIRQQPEPHGLRPQGHLPTQQPQELHHQLQGWLKNLEQEQYITPQHAEALHHSLNQCHTPEAFSQFAQDLYTHLPATAPKPPGTTQSAGLSRPLLEALSKASPSAVVHMLKHHCGLQDAAELLKRTGCVFEEHGTLQWGSQNTFLDNLENPAQAPSSVTAPFHHIAEALHRTSPTTLQQATQELTRTSTTHPQRVGSKEQAPAVSPPSSHAKAHAAPLQDDPWMPWNPPAKDSPLYPLYQGFSTLLNAGNPFDIQNHAGGSTVYNPNTIAADASGFNDLLSKVASFFKPQGKLDPADYPDYSNLQAAMADDAPALKDFTTLFNENIPGVTPPTPFSALTIDSPFYYLQPASDRTDTVLGMYNNLLNRTPALTPEQMQKDPVFLQLQSILNATSAITPVLSQANADLTGNGGAFNANGVFQTLFDGYTPAVGGAWHPGALPSSMGLLLALKKTDPSLDLSQYPVPFMNPASGSNFFRLAMQTQINQMRSDWKAYFTSPAVSTPPLSAAQAAALANKVVSYVNSQIDVDAKQIAALPDSTSSTDLFAAIQKNLDALNVDPNTVGPTKLASITSLVQQMYVGTSENPPPGAQADQINNRLTGLDFSFFQYQLLNAYAALHGKDPTLAAEIKDLLAKGGQAQNQTLGISKEMIGVTNTLNAIFSKYLTNIMQAASNPLAGLANDLKGEQGAISLAQKQLSGFPYAQTTQAISNALYPPSGPSLAQQIANVTGIKPMIPPSSAGVLPFLPNQSTSGGTGAWFDTSRLSGISSLSGLQTALDSYFAHMAQDGITDVKLSFTQLSGSTGNTMQSLYDQFPGGQAAVLPMLEATAKSYGMTLGLSVGGEVASSGTLQLGSDGTAAADQFWKNQCCVKGASCFQSIDFDIEGQTVSAFYTTNSPATIAAFFAELHKLAAAEQPPVSIQLTLTGSVGDNTNFKNVLNGIPCPIDKINLMEYNNGQGYYLNPANPTWGAEAWMSFIKTNAPSLSGTQIMKMLTMNFEDATPYNNMSEDVTQADDAAWVASVNTNLSQPGSITNGRGLENLTAGGAACVLVNAAATDTVSWWNTQYPNDKIQQGTQFGNSNWWIDSNRVDIHSPVLKLWPEVQGSAEALSIQLGIPLPPPTPPIPPS